MQIHYLEITFYQIIHIVYGLKGKIQFSTLQSCAIIFGKIVYGITVHIEV